MSSIIKIFCCYAREDQPLLQRLIRHLMPLQRQGLIKVWSDIDINAGDEREQAIDNHLDTAQIILLLVSPDFMASDYSYSKEMQQAMQRHELGEARVIPVLLRPTLWKGAPFEKLQMLPANAKPVVHSSWHTEDEALYDVAERISVVVKELTINNDLTEARKLYDEQRYEGALVMYDRLLQLEAHNAFAHLGKGKTLLALQHYMDSLACYESAFKTDPGIADVRFYLDRAYLLCQLQRFEDSIATYDEVILKDPLLAQPYIEKAKILLLLRRYREALIMYEQAIRLEPAANYYVQKGDLLYKLRRFEDALESYEQALRLKPGEAAYYDKKGKVLLWLRRYEEALALYDQAFSIEPLALYYDKQGKALLGLARYEEALALYAQCIETYGDDASYFYGGKGKALFHLGQYEEALVAYDQALRLSDPRSDPEWYRDKGAIHEHLARQAFEMAERLHDPGHDKEDVFLLLPLPVETLTVLRTLIGHTSSVYSVAMSPDGQTLVSGSNDKTIKVWDIRAGKELRTLIGHTSYVRSVAMSLDGQTLVSGSGDKTIKVWDIHTGKELRTLTGHTNPVWSVAISSDGQTLVSGSGDNTIKVWG